MNKKLILLSLVAVLAQQAVIASDCCPQRQPKTCERKCEKPKKCCVRRCHQRCTDIPGGPWTPRKAFNARYRSETRGCQTAPVSTGCCQKKVKPCAPKCAPRACPQRCNQKPAHCPRTQCCRPKSNCCPRTKGTCTKQGCPAGSMLGSNY